MVGIQQQKIPSSSREKKNTKTAVGLHENRVTWLETSAWATALSWFFIHTQSFQPVQFHPSLHVSPLLFPFLQTHRHYFINQCFFFSFLCFILSEPVDPCQQNCRSLSESEAAAGPSEGGTVSPSVYTFLRAITTRRLSESGTRPGAVLVTLKFLLQFCQI